MAIVKCFACYKEFERANAEINRNKKIGRKTFCSRSCSGSDRDQYSPFRVFLKTCKMRMVQKNREVNLSLQDLKEQWDKQKGICPYTGWKMKIAPCQSRKSIKKTPDRASLDRIDSKKGYVKNNIQFVSLIAQYAKNDWDECVILDFANAVCRSR